MQELEEIRRWFVAEVQGTRFVADMLAGRVDEAAYRRYLHSAFHYAQYSPVVMALAAARTSRSHPELSRYLLRHAEEEQGHDAWALEDLAELGTSEQAVRETPPAITCSVLVGYVHYVAAHANPIGLFGWMYVLEALGNDLASAAGDKLVGSLRVPTAIRFLARHGVTDQDHAAEIATVIERHVELTEDARAVCDVARIVASLYGDMLREAGGEQKRWA